MLTQHNRKTCRLSPDYTLAIRELSGDETMFNHFGTVSAIVGVWFGAGVFLVLSTLYPNDILSGFAIATKTCRAAEL